MTRAIEWIVREAPPNVYRIDWSRLRRNLQRLPADRADPLESIPKV